MVKRYLPAAKLALFACLITALCVWGCSDGGDDTAAPAIQILQPQSTSLTAPAESSIQLVARYTDDGGLDSAYITILPVAGGTGNAWHAPVTRRFGGQKSVTDTLELYIPVAAQAGEYTLTVACYDTKQNTSSWTASLTITNANDLQKPTLTVTSPLANASFGTSGSIALDAQATDNVELLALEANLYHRATNGTSTGSSLKQEYMDCTGLTSASLTRSMTLPSGLAAGDYLIRFSAIDQAFNEQRVEVAIVLQ